MSSRFSYDKGVFHLYIYSFLQTSFFFNFVNSMDWFKDWNQLILTCTDNFTLFVKRILDLSLYEYINHLTKSSFVSAYNYTLDSLLYGFHFSHWLICIFQYFYFFSWHKILKHKRMWFCPLSCITDIIFLWIKFIIFFSLKYW